MENPLYFRGFPQIASLKGLTYNPVCGKVGLDLE